MAVSRLEMAGLVGMRAHQDRHLLPALANAVDQAHELAIRLAAGEAVLDEGGRHERAIEFDDTFALFEGLTEIAGFLRLAGERAE